jgi:WD40 repeat protein
MSAGFAMSAADVFLSYNEADRESVLAVQRLLEARGISTFLYHRSQTAGFSWPQVLEEQLRSVRAVAVFLGRQLAGWQKKEIGFALARHTEEEKAGHAFPVIPVFLPNADRTPSFLLLHHGVDLSRGLADPEALDALERAIHGAVPPEMDGLAADLCPYRGLSAFREEDAAFFVGRETFAHSLLQGTFKGGLVTLVGPSGSGKSSVVQAGLVPLLRQQRPPHNTWDVSFFTPGDRPFHRLAAALIPFLEPDKSETDRLYEAERLGDRLRSAELPLASVVERILEKSRGTDRLLVGADQLEELFTQTPEADRRRFVSTLLETQDRAPTTLVATLRADFYGHAIALSRDLSDRIVPGQVTLGAMTQEELRRAVEEPARRARLEFEIGLVDRILEDVGNEPGNLPLLEFALQELWVRREGRVLRHSAYSEIGAVAGSIAKRAEEEFAKFSPQQQHAARRFLTSRLVRVARADEGAEDTRLRSELESLDPVDASVVQALTDARLLVTGRDEGTGKETVEVAHEALIRHWTRMREWVNEDREFLLWRQRLRERSLQWQRTREEDFLLRGAPLNEAEVWLARRVHEFQELERLYIQESAALRERERMRRLQTQRRITRLAVAAAVTFLILAGLATIQWVRAREEGTIALARQLAVQAELVQSEADNLLDRSTLLAIESLRRHPLFEGNLAIQQGLKVLAKPVATLAHSGRVNTIAYSHDGRYVATGSWDKTARVFEAMTGKEITQVRFGDKVNAVAFSSRGQYVAAVSDDKTARVLEATTGKELARVKFPEKVNAVAFSPDGDYVAARSDDGTARVFEARTGRLVREFGRGEKIIAELAHGVGENVSHCQVAFDPDGRYVATSSYSEVTVFDTRSGKVVAKVEHPDMVNVLAFSQNGKYLATGGFQRTARLLDIQKRRQIPLEVGHTIQAIAFSPDSRLLAAGGWDHTVTIFETQNPSRRWRLVDQDNITAVAFSPDGRSLAWSSQDNTARVLNLTTGERTDEILHQGSVWAIAFSPNGRYLATGSSDRTARISALSTPRTDLSLQGVELAAVLSQDGGKVAALIQAPSTNSTEGLLNELQVFDASTGLEGARIRITSNLTTLALAFGPDGRYIAFGGWDKTVHLFDASNGRKVSEFP